MKLGFNKADDGNVFAVILNGTEQEKFSYIKMISMILLNYNSKLNGTIIIVI